MSVAADRSAAPPAQQPVVGQSPATGAASGAGETVHTPAGEPCPLCGAPLDPEQEWCLRCGAAARTRLATSPNWKAPIIALAVVAALSLGVIAAAAVKLVGDSGSGATPATTTVTTAPGAAAAAPTTATPGAAGTPTSPSVTSPGTSTIPAVTPPAAKTPATVAPVTLAPATMVASSTVTLNGTVNPQGVPTTYQFHFGKTASYGSWPAAPVPLGSGTSAIAVNSKVAYLTPGTTYHYVLIASKAGRTIKTADAKFTTLPAH